MNLFKGYDIDKLERGCVREVGEISRIAAAEGIVLLKNDNVLPFDRSKTLSIFGRTQIDYVKSGTGSGGQVHTPYCVNILDGLKGRININSALVDIYKAWLIDNPFDNGHGWATEPWAQKEMPLSDEICARAAEISDYAMIVIGRTAGEDRDNFAEKESYLLSDEEERLIETVTRHFEKVLVVLNTGNIIDMKWVEKYSVPAVLYSWQGGAEGGNALADVLLGDISPSGRLTDTVAYDINDYPSTKNHGAKDKNIFEEDIYVGYRYFETFAKDRVIYPFGFGLSYTSFKYDYKASFDGEKIKISARVKNVGEYSGKAVLEFYFEAPVGRLGNPKRQLVRYKKTKTLLPGEEGIYSIEFPIEDMASYDDKERFAYVISAGEYKIFAGENVRDAELVFALTLDEKITKQHRQVMAPTEPFKRLKPSENYEITYEDAPLRSYNLDERKREHIETGAAPIGNIGISLKDVAEGRNTLDEFVGQLSVEDLTHIVKGEGMNSPKVTRGTAAAFGGVTTELLSLGIPTVCATDGPSGIRMDTGHSASLIPNGTCLASTWNDEIVTELYEYVGIELRSNEVDILLGPGTNIHRNPLCGRNFEYFSEDPYLSGRIAAASARGLHNAGVAGAVKHFACNSQEFNRTNTDVIVSERALREIYLKPFEIAVKEGSASVIMTSYNRVNGIYTAANYDLNTSVLRDEWGYTGFVMTDWWTKLEPYTGREQTRLSEMVTAQNDIYMVVRSAKDHKDDLLENVSSGALDIYYLRKCAKNLLRFIIGSPAMSRKPKTVSLTDRSDYTELSLINNVKSGQELSLESADAVELEYKTTGSEIAQYVINAYSGGEYLSCVIVMGTVDEPKRALVELPKDTKRFSLDYPASFEYVNVKYLKK